MSTINLNTTTATNGAGIDVTSVVDQILYAERAPERLWQQQQTALKAEGAAFSDLRTNLGTLNDAVIALKDILGALEAKLVESSKPEILNASAQPSAMLGVHVVTVGNLATTSSYYTDAVTSDAAFAGGKFEIKVGAGAAQTVTVSSTNNTVSTLVSSINNQNLGVTASVIRDANGERLALVSKTSGDPGDITVSGNTSGLTFHKSVTGQNASLTLDGISLSSTTNTLAGALEGVTLNLATADPDTEVLLTIGSDQKGAEQAVQDFVSRYNSVISAINGQFATGGNASTAGPLASNGSLRSLEMRLLSAATHSMSGNNGFVNLASLGINMANDGTLTVDATKLHNVTSTHFAEFQNFFQSLTPTAGFAQSFSNTLKSLTDSTTGLVSLNLQENASKQSVVAKQISEFEDRLVARQKELIAQYSRVDMMLRQLPVLQSQISSQLDSLKKS